MTITLTTASCAPRSGRVYCSHTLQQLLKLSNQSYGDTYTTDCDRFVFWLAGPMRHTVYTRGQLRECDDEQVTHERGGYWAAGQNDRQSRRIAENNRRLVRHFSLPLLIERFRRSIAAFVKAWAA